MKSISILGSTGSIGKQALDVVQRNPDEFKVMGLTARRGHELLEKQAMGIPTGEVAILDPDAYSILSKKLQGTGIEVLSGEEGINQVATLENVDTVLTAMVGFSGFIPTIKAIEQRKNIALANKETLVVGGSIINRLAEENGVSIIPVDSEHSAIFQCMVGEEEKSVERIILTASGGPFRGYQKSQLENIGPEQALKHPNWDMGAKITIDSATLMNKGLEVIEARWLFGLEPDQIDVVVHPQSIIHSMVEFVDGSIKAQLGIPDMRLPIHYALAYPERMEASFPRMNFENPFQLDFEPPNLKTFQNLQLAFEAMKKGGNLPCVLNASNEIAVQGFLEGKLDFLGIPRVVESCLSNLRHISDPTLEDLLETDTESRKIATDLIY